MDFSKYEKDLGFWYGIFGKTNFTNFLASNGIDLENDKFGFLEITSQNKSWVNSTFNHPNGFVEFEDFFIENNINFKSLPFKLRDIYNKWQSNSIPFSEEDFVKLLHLEDKNTKQILGELNIIAKDLNLIMDKLKNIGNSNFDINETQVEKLKIILKEFNDVQQKITSTLDTEFDDIKELITQIDKEDSIAEVENSDNFIKNFIARLNSRINSITRLQILIFGVGFGFFITLMFAKVGFL